MTRQDPPGRSKPRCTVMPHYVVLRSNPGQRIDFGSPDRRDRPGRTGKLLGQEQKVAAKARGFWAKTRARRCWAKADGGARNGVRRFFFRLCSAEKRSGQDRGNW